MASKYENYTAFEPETIAFLDGLDNQEEDSELDSLEVGEVTDSTEQDGDTSDEGNSEEEIEEVNDEVDESHDDTPSTINIDGIGEVSIDDIKSWRQGSMRQADYTRKTQELARQREENAKALEVYEYLRDNPQLLDGLTQVGADSKIINQASPDHQLLQQVLFNQRALETDMQVQRLHAKYGDFNEVDLYNIAHDLGITDLEAAYKIMNYDNRPVYDENAIIEKAKAEFKTELENNKRKVSTVVSNKGQTITSNKPTLTDDEKRVAFNMGMTEAEYLKWRQ